MSGSNNGALPGTTFLSWEQMCADSDPNFYQDQLQPWVYRFSSGRQFVQQLPYYEAIFGEPLEQAVVLDFALVTLDGALLTFNLDQASIDNGNS